MQVPAHVEYERAIQRRARARPAGPVRPGGADPGRRAQPDPDDEAAARAAGDPDRHQRAQPSSPISEVGRRRAADRGADPACASCSTRAAVGEHFAILHDAEKVIADPVVRNWGTVGGSLCQADPSEDLSAAFAALKATHGDPRPGRQPDGAGPGVPHRARTRPWSAGRDAHRDPDPDRGRAAAAPTRRSGRRVGDWPVGAAGRGAVAGRRRGRRCRDRADRGRRAAVRGGRRPRSSCAAHRPPIGNFPGPVRSPPSTAGRVSDQRGPADYKRHLACELTVRALRAALRRAGQASPRISSLGRLTCRSP